MSESFNKWKLDRQKVLRQSSVWRAPSNIALVKYWGKRSNQIPENSSVSFCLSKSYTESRLSLFEKELGRGHQILMKGLPYPQFLPKIEKFFNSIPILSQLLNDFDFCLETENSFPHGAGIASSASGFAALSLCLFEIFGDNDFSSLNRTSLSSMARMGSGSACRSFLPGFTFWGHHPEIAGSSDLHGLGLSEIHPEFQSLGNTICLVGKDEKAVSSSAGHNLMRESEYASTKYELSNRRVVELVQILKRGDWEQFIKLVELEALALHAFLMMSGPGCILLAPGSLSVINKFVHWRNSTRARACFTIDAGPNIHLIYHPNERESVLEFVQHELSCDLVDENAWIDDSSGPGPDHVGKQYE